MLSDSWFDEKSPVLEGIERRSGEGDMTQRMFCFIMKSTQTLIKTKLYFQGFHETIDGWKVSLTENVGPIVPARSQTILGLLNSHTCQFIEYTFKQQKTNSLFDFDLNAFAYNPIQTLYKQLWHDPA